MPISPGNSQRCTTLGQWNAKNLLRIKGEEVTGLTIREEMMSPTLDLVNSLKAQRLAVAAFETSAAIE